MTDQQIAYFLQAAQCLNFTEAARHFFISQPTLSKQMVMLEEELGVQLFFRNNRKIRLTTAGQFLFQELSLITRQKDKIIQQAKFMNSGAVGTLSIGVQDALWNDPFLFGLFYNFQQKYPEIQYSLNVDVYHTLLNGLRQDEFDIVISRHFEGEHSNLVGLNYRKIKKNTPCILMHKSNPLALRESVELADLKNEAFVVLVERAGRFSGPSLVSACEEAGFTPRIAYFANCNSARVMYVELACGITLMDEEITLHPKSHVRRIPLAQKDVAHTGTYVLSSRDTTNKNVRTFLDYLEKSLPPSDV